MKTAKLWGWEFWVPEDFILQRRPLGLKIIDGFGQQIANVSLSLNQAASIDVSTPIHLDVKLQQQVITITPPDQ